MRNGKWLGVKDKARTGVVESWMALKDKLIINYICDKRAKNGLLPGKKTAKSNARLCLASTAGGL